MRVVAITRLFPNPLEPLWCLFNKQQLAALGRLDEVEVLGVIPWFPGARATRRWSAAGRLADVPATETVDGLRVAHPRYLFVPKLPAASAALYAASLLPRGVAAAARHRRAPRRVGLSRRRGHGDAGARARAAVGGQGARLGSERHRAHPVGARALRALLPRATLHGGRVARARRRAGGARRGARAHRHGARTASTRRCSTRAIAARRARQLGLPAAGRVVVYVGRLVREKGCSSWSTRWRRCRRS